MQKSLKSLPRQVQTVLELRELSQVLEAEDHSQGFETVPENSDLFYSDLLEAIRNQTPDTYEKICSGEVTCWPFRSHYLG